MKMGAVVTGVVALLALSGVMFAFVSNASPYVTIAQAKGMGPEAEVHVVGDLDKESLKADARANTVDFMLKDKSGGSIPVHYDGPAPANMGEATQVVVVGSIENGTFKARKMLIKCPSKYEGGKE